MFKLLLWLVLGLWTAKVAPQHEHHRQKRIVNGDTTTIEKIPYQVALVFAKFPVCGGAIIQEDVIITAAHCVCAYSPNMTEIYAGMTSKKDFLKVDGIKIKTVLMHEDYNYTGDPTPDDIALLVLEEKLTFGPTIQKVDLVEEDFELPVNATVSGWGSTNCNFSLSNEDACNGWYAVNLQAGYLNITKREDGLIYAPRTKTAGNYGDSGGPVTANNKLIGISRNCDIVEPNVFDFDATSVLDYLPWIRQTLNTL